jgi:hypothetical protein
VAAVDCKPSDLTAPIADKFVQNLSEQVTKLPASSSTWTGHDGSMTTIHALFMVTLTPIIIRYTAM